MEQFSWFEWKWVFSFIEPHEIFVSMKESNFCFSKIFVIYLFFQKRILENKFLKMVLVLIKINSKTSIQNKERFWSKTNYLWWNDSKKTEREFSKSSIKKKICSLFNVTKWSIIDFWKNRGDLKFFSTNFFLEKIFLQVFFFAILIKKFLVIWSN